MKTDIKYNSNVSKNDLEALKERTEFLNRSENIDFTGKDLDVPGRKVPSQKTKKTLKDEENTLYGKGSEKNENLETSNDY